MCDNKCNSCKCKVELTHTQALKVSLQRRLLRLTPWLFPAIWLFDRIGHLTGMWCLGV